MALEQGLDTAKLPSGYTDVLWIIFDLCYFTLARIDPRDVVMSEAQPPSQQMIYAICMRRESCHAAHCASPSAVAFAGSASELLRSEGLCPTGDAEHARRNGRRNAKVPVAMLR